MELSEVWTLPRKRQSRTMVPPWEVTPIVPQETRLKMNLQSVTRRSPDWRPAPSMMQPPCGSEAVKTQFVMSMSQAPRSIRMMPGRLESRLQQMKRRPSILPPAPAPINSGM